MEKNFLKSFGMAAAFGALAATASAAVTSVVPAEGTVAEVSAFEVTFDGAVAWDWAVINTDTAPAIEWNGVKVATCTELTAENNTLKFAFKGEPLTMVGDYNIVLKGNTYTVAGAPGENVTLHYNVEVNPDAVSISPATSLQTSLQFFSITFNDALSVAAADGLTTEGLPTLSYETEPGVWEVRAHLLIDVTGNRMGLSMPAAVTDEGNYKLNVPGSCYTADGKPGTDLEFTYQVIPAVDNSIVVTPTPGEVEELEGTVSFTFNNATEVAWNLADMTTEKAPSLSWNGTVVAHITNLKAEGNVLYMEVPYQNMKGEYEITIPAGLYSVDGEFGGQLNAVYTIAESLDPITITPGETLQTSLQHFTIRFNDAVVVNVNEAIETPDLPVLEIQTPDGVWEVRQHLSVSATGNVMGLSARTPITEQGVYRLTVPGTLYNLDGNRLGQDLEFTYQVIPGSAPLDVTVVPAEGNVEQLGGLMSVTFNDATNVAWDMANMGTANCPVITRNGELIAHVTRLTSDGNTLNMDLDEYALKGDYVVTIQAGSYYVDGELGYERSFYYTVENTIEPISIVPAVSVQTSLQFFTIRFNDANQITILDNLETPDLPVLSKETEPGVWTVYQHLNMSATGNAMGLSARAPITEEGNYKLNVSGDTYLIDGRPGQDLEFTYEVVKSEDNNGIVANPAPGEIETLEEMTITFTEAETVAWDASAYNTANAPLVKWNGEVVAHSNVFTADGNKLVLRFPEQSNKGSYQVVIAAGSYTVDGQPGAELTFDYTINVTLDPITVTPEVNVVPSLQFFSLRFNDAKGVSVNESLETPDLPTLAIETEPGVWNTVHHFYNIQATGNLLGFSTNDPIVEPGYYRLTVPGNCYFVDGFPGEDLEFFFTVTGPASALDITPAPGNVDEIDNISINFGEAEVAWNLEGLTTATAPYYTRNGVVEGHFTNLTVSESNTLVLTPTIPIVAKGNYQVVIPAGLYTVDGVFGSELTIDYTISYEGWMMTVNPAAEIQTSLQSFSFMFEDASQVTLTDESMLVEADYPTLSRETEPFSGEFEVVYTFKEASAAGTAFGFTMLEPVTTPGVYRLTVPGRFYFVDGMQGEDINLNYEIVEPWSPVTIEPATGEVDNETGLQFFTVTFNSLSAEGDATVAWVEDMTEELKPTLSRDGEVIETFSDLGGKGNQLAFSLPVAIKDGGQYVVTIKADSYTVDGVNGEELNFNYIINASGIDAVFGADAQSFNVYDFNGRLVKANADRNDLKALKGIYVVNGKKCIFR